ncbi:hypothetical protein G7Y89_g8431 [Cudoniella acicularis]|uniref:WSC domain-containing protein n=1 Tax=Cudoniella acicularis TaxID=354080 RepID=A0A8H4W3K3_9HELO|nr:hypothetical protein G7Y89_g8431 [Cudoniella acicularis]
MMFSYSRWSTHLALGALCLVSIVNLVSALDIEYCSSLNTASTNRNSSIYQSNGLCHDFCISDYAFAVLQDDGCWCSNYAPSTTTTGCTDQCPGFPSDICGGSGVYGYIALSIAPSGTQGGSSATASTAAPVTVTETPSAVTVFHTLTASISTSSSDTTSFSTSSTPSTTQSPSTSSTLHTTTTTSSSPSTSTWTPTPVTSLETVTGQVRTVTVTPTVPPNSQSLNTVAKNSSSGLTTGGAVGLTVGLVVLVAVLGAMIFYYLRKRREDKAAEYNNVSRRGSTAGFGAPSRTMSENSRYVLGTDGRKVVETWEPDPEMPGSRRSRLVPVDPRLDPFAPVYQNKSRESINTIRDDHDYSRRVHQQGPILRATNPDE